VEKVEDSTSNTVVYVIQLSVSWKLQQYAYNEVPFFRSVFTKMSRINICVILEFLNVVWKCS